MNIMVYIVPLEKHVVKIKGRAMGIWLVNA
jgi:hypothetical protein